MQIAPGIYMIQGTVGVRPLQLFLLWGTQRTVLLDTGCAPDPERFVFPYLKALGLSPREIDVVINTHPDLDHCGGNYAIKMANPELLLTCGEADRELIEDPQVMWDRRYNAYAAPHDLSYGDDSRKWIFEMLGEKQSVDFTWRGGETLRLSVDWTVEIHRTPGHSAGHLSVFDRRSETMLSGDAVQGSVYLDTNGKPALCPTYLNVEPYLATIQYFESLPIAQLASCHWPIKRGAAVGEFLKETRDFVVSAEDILLAELRENPPGLTLKELIERSGPKLGFWPRETDPELVYALAGNLDRLIALGQVNAATDAAPVRYRLKS